jgi:phosphoribosyl-dephospho-CoA transferase
MEFHPHDLLKLKGEEDLICDSPLPDWVKESLSRAPFVVVRRAPLMKKLVPIGIRGESRSERFAAFIPYDKILETITPEQLVEKTTWKQNERFHCIDALQSLPHVSKILSRFSVHWGPTGSVGFELASNVYTAIPTSDLDLVVRTPSLLPMELAVDLRTQISKVKVRVDVQLETPKGAISLDEYSKGKSPVLLRTENGPQLVKIQEIWNT